MPPFTLNLFSGAAAPAINLIIDRACDPVLKFT
jgi:hypothetical protein